MIEGETSISLRKFRVEGKKLRLGRMESAFEIFLCILHYRISCHNKKEKIMRDYVNLVYHFLHFKVTVYLQHKGSSVLRKILGMDRLYLKIY